jgi:hypothetical protein
VGGLFYSIGAVLNLLNWPNLYPGVFGSHELFHLFVIAGSACHFWFIVRVVLPATTAPVVSVLSAPRFHGRVRWSALMAVRRAWASVDSPVTSLSGMLAPGLRAKRRPRTVED